MALKAGQREKAAVRLETAIGLFRRLGMPYYEARAWLQLAHVYAGFGAHASSKQALQQARRLSRASGSRLLEEMGELVATVVSPGTGDGGWEELEAQLLQLVALPEMKTIQREEDGQFLPGLLAGMAQSLAQPETAATEPVSFPQGAGQRDVRDTARFFEGYVHYQRGELAAARTKWIATLEGAPRREVQIMLLTFVGRSFAREGRTAEAIDSLVRAVTAVEGAVEGVRLEEFLAGYLGSHYQTIFEALVELLLIAGRPAEAFDYAERARSRAFLLAVGNRRLELREGADRELVQQAENARRHLLDLERQAVAASAGESELLASKLRQARERYQALMVRLKVTNPDLSARTRIEPLQLQAVQAELAPDAALISYFVSSSQVHAWVIDRKSFQSVRLGPTKLGSAACWAAEAGRRAGGRGARRLGVGCGKEAARAKRYFAMLIAPLRPHLHHRRLILVPHRELHYVPFAALRDPRTGRYLVEDFTLTYAPSASALAALRAKESPVAGNALVLGAPEELDPALAPLPAAKTEAEAVARLLGTDPLLGAAAGEGRLYDLAGDVDLLHIAAHGLYEPRNPLFSRVALAADAEHDGNLEVHEILSAVDLSGVNLVVLSACETARGERSGGDEITSLARAFLAAGSPGVISTLWSVDDDASAALMTGLYRRLLDGATAAEALRQAQLALLRDPHYRASYFWAGFSLTGDPQGRWRVSP